MLGVLQAGGAFVPLDPTHPTSRLRSLIGSVEVKIMLCSRNREELLSTVAENLIPLDEQFLDEIFPSPAGAVQQNEVNSNNAAYLIFTSGSTGQPKVNHLPFTFAFQLTSCRVPCSSIGPSSRPQCPMASQWIWIPNAGYCNSQHTHSTQVFSNRYPR